MFDVEVDWVGRGTPQPTRGMYALSDMMFVPRIGATDSGISTANRLGIATHYASEWFPEHKHAVEQEARKQRARLTLVAPPSMWQEAMLHAPSEAIQVVSASHMRVKVRTTKSAHPALVQPVAEATNAITRLGADIEKATNAAMKAALGDRIGKWVRGKRTAEALAKLFPEVPAEAYIHAFAYRPDFGRGL